MGLPTLSTKFFGGKIQKGKKEDLSQYAVHNYKIEGRFFEEEKILEVEQRINYKNQHKVSFDRIYFHLYPNAFKEEEKVPFFKEELIKAYPLGFQPGYIDIEEVLVGNKGVNYEIGGENNTILAIDLLKELQPNQTHRH